MKILILFILTVLTINTNAKIWRVNNNPGLKADFLTLADAHTVASPGDTIYLEPSIQCYAGFTWSKPLVLIGTGYFLAENAITESNNLTANVCGDITFNPGSEGSQMMGISNWNNTVVIKASDLVLKRNQIKNISMPRQSGVRLTNLIIVQNYIKAIYGGVYGGTGFYVDDLIFSNNIVVSELWFYYTKYNDDCPCYDQALTGRIYNNVFLGTVTLQSCEFRNNIFYKSDLPTNILLLSDYNVVEENIFSRILPWTDTLKYQVSDSNLDNVNMTTLFAGGGSPDGQWQINPSATNPLKEICGAFAGQEPYVISGIPRIPVIYHLDVPYTTTRSAGLNITVKARSTEN